LKHVHSLFRQHHEKPLRQKVEMRETAVEAPQNL